MNNNKRPQKPGKIAYNLALLLSAGIIAAVFLYMMVFSLFFKRTEISSYDKELTSMPEFTLDSFFSGEYTNQLSKYFTDTVHNRDEFRREASKIKAYYGIDQEEDIYGSSSEPDEPSESDISNVSEEPSADVSADMSETVSRDDSSHPVETSSEPPEESSALPKEEEIIDSIVVLGKGSDVRAMEVFYYSEKVCLTFADRINSFAAKVKGVNVYSMVIPKQCAYYIKDSKKYGSLWDQSMKADTTIKNALNGVTYVDAYHALERHTSEEIYARTDHHWTGLGAFYAAEEFAKTAGVPFASLNQYELKRREGYVGTMYNFTNRNPKLLNNPEDFITLVPNVDHMADYYDKDYKFVTEHDIFWYISDQMKSGWYSTFLGNDDYMVRIKSPVYKNGRKLMIIKDSYGNALSPLFLSSFEEIYIADLRYMNVNAIDFINNHGVTDVLFAICSYSAVNGNISSRINTITTLGK